MKFNMRSRNRYQRRKKKKIKTTSRKRRADKKRMTVPSFADYRTGPRTHDKGKNKRRTLDSNCK